MIQADPSKAIYCDSNCGPLFGGSIVKEGEKWIRGDFEWLTMGM